jgi:hypothetical protein
MILVYPVEVFSIADTNCYCTAKFQATRRKYVSVKKHAFVRTMDELVASFSTWRMAVTCWKEVPFISIRASNSKPLSCDKDCLTQLMSAE